MAKIPSTAQAWAEVNPYGKVFLRKFTSYQWVHLYVCIQTAASEVIPPLLEYYKLNVPLNDNELMNRLHVMGYPENIFVAGLNEGSSGNQTFIAVTQYGGETLHSTIYALTKSEKFNEIKTAVRSFGVCLGTLHAAGLICDDTDPLQFVVDEDLVVRRIDIHTTKVRMDIVPNHPIFGGINEHYFEYRRLTVEGFEQGVGNELLVPINLCDFLDSKFFSDNEALQQCRDGYLSAGGTADAWTLAKTAYDKIRDRD